MANFPPAFFNWWSSDSVNAPFYGAYFAALAVEGGGSILASDNGTDSFAQYVVYKKEKPFKVVLVNTEYYSGTGSRSATKFTLTGLENGRVQALRLTGPSSETSVSRLQSDPSLEPSIGGTYRLNIFETRPLSPSVSMKNTQTDRVLTSAPRSIFLER